MDNLSCRQLDWVQKNAERRVHGLHGRPTEAIGPVAAEVLRAEQSAGPAWRRQVVGVIQDCAGGELLDHATVVDLRDGVLRLQVMEPALLYGLRLRWEQRLLAELQAILPGAGIWAIRFTTGSTT